MATSGQLTGMRGVYLVAAELSKRGLIASPTSRSAVGADVLVTDQRCSRAWSVQVKTNARTHSFWLLTAKTKETVADSHVYVLVNIRSRNTGEEIEYFVVPSQVIASRMSHAVSRAKTSEWYQIDRAKILEFQEKWDLFSA